jgi:predicted nucleotidyltransferase
MPQAHIRIPPATVRAFCKRHDIAKLALFGSVLGQGFRPESDVDFLVEFRQGAVVGLLGLARIERELSDLVGRKADLRTAADLSRYFRDDVVRSAEVLYKEE